MSTIPARTEPSSPDPPDGGRPGGDPPDSGRPSPSPVGTGALDVMRRALPGTYDRGTERLTLPLGEPAEDGTVPVPTYGFEAYQRRYGRPPPAPRYLLTLRRALTRSLVVRVWFTREEFQAQESVDVVVPADRHTGDTVTIPLPGRADELTDRLRLRRLRPLEPVEAEFAAGAWEVTALLGNLAKLLWIVGAEHEELARRLRDVADQRGSSTARGASLDLLGLDLGAPRFPPRPHTPDAATVALYHLDDLPPTGVGGLPVPGVEVTAVVSDGAPAHAGTNKGAHSGRTGRFRHAFGFGPGSGAINVPDSPDFAVPATAGFTVEAVVRPDRTAATGALVAKRSPLNTETGTGWALTVGSFRGVDRNLRFSLSDGAREIDLFADRDLGDGAFHHVAGVLRREPLGTSVALLYLDGAEVARRVAGPFGGDALGALTSTARLVMGQGTEVVAGKPTTAQYFGILDEVRISRQARDTFEPVTGESDEQYRRRLRLFQRWLLPTPDGLRDAINAAAGPLADAPRDPAPFVVDEPVDVVATGALPVRVLPRELPVSQTLAADGDPGTPEELVVGTAEDEADFDPAWLIRHPDRRGLDFADDGNSRRMQLGVLLALDALLDRLAAAGAGTAEPRAAEAGRAEPPSPGVLRVLKAYDPGPDFTADEVPGPTGLHAVGRAVLLTHTTMAAAELGVHAHAAGFAWVRHTREGWIHAAQQRGDVFRITGTTPGERPGPPDVVEGGLLQLGFEPEPEPAQLADTDIRWSVTRSGGGDAVVRPGEPGLLRALAAGDVSVRVEVARHGRVAGGTLPVRIGLADTTLAAGGSIGRDGRLGATEAETAGPPAPGFDERHLLLRTDDLTGRNAAVSYGTDEANRRMQLVTSRALDRLLAVLSCTTGTAGGAGTLTVLRSYVPADGADHPSDVLLHAQDVGLHAQGRALLLAHDTLSAPALAARAFAAGLDHVQVRSRVDEGAPDAVRVAVAAGEQLAVSGPAELRVGESAPVGVEPAAEPVAACFADDGARVYLAEPGTHRVTAFHVTADAPTSFPRLTRAASRVVAPFPGALAFGAERLFVAHEEVGEELGQVSVLDPVTLAAAGPAISGPRPVALATDHDRLYVAYRGDRTVRAYELSTGREQAHRTLPGRPRSMVSAARGTSLYVVLDGGRWCRVERAGLKVREIVSTGDRHAGAVAVTADGRKLYVVCPGGGTVGGDGKVKVYRPPGPVAVATVGGFPAGTVPVALSLSADQELLYVATAGSPGAVGRIHLVDVKHDVRLPQVFSPGHGGPAMAASPVGAAYPPCLVAAPRRSGTVVLADPAPLGAVPPCPPRLAAELPLGTGAGEELVWSSTPDGHGAAEPSAPGAPHSTVRGVTPGWALVRATYLDSGGLRPFQCEVRLKPGLVERRGAVGKDQYDLILNILNWFHPLGVECRTDRLRALVELGPEEAALLPGYTFPTYHVSDPFSSPFIRLRKDGHDDPPL
ncbi:LamG-like jellyroll fold domain-containing protein [Kitasatospora herbaricolor]|uniref:LamG-like jellyroll fold domain-containing protein n=1 Tax=Kitasatospora herbaricolor TaxID=68217 RepID=UPI0036DD6C3B